VIGDKRPPSPLKHIQPARSLAEYTTERLNVLGLPVTLEPTRADLRRTADQRELVLSQPLASAPPSNHLSECPYQLTLRLIGHITAPYSRSGTQRRDSARNRQIIPDREEHSKRGRWQAKICPGGKKTPCPPRARQAKSKARIAQYERMVAESETRTAIGC
jgi:hypothetical protein